jgi:hypothetical protein
MILISRKSHVQGDSLKNEVYTPEPIISTGLVVEVILVEQRVQRR